VRRQTRGDPRLPGASRTSPKKKTGGLTAEERAALRERAREAKDPSSVQGESTVLAKIAELPEPDRSLAERIHALVRATAPELEPRTWYGMPAYAKGGKVLCYFQSAAKFKTRYATFGFTDQARLDRGALWPVAFALKELGPAEEAKLAALVKRAAR
jgi:uncharacterized protein YdhG (YjbR/CyaY superfamily)